METKTKILRTPRIKRIPKQPPNRTSNVDNLPDTLVFIVNPRAQALTTKNLMPEQEYILGFSTAEKALDFILESQKAGIFTGTYNLSFLTKQEYLTNIKESVDKILVDIDVEKLTKGTDFLVIKWQPSKNWDERPMRKI